MTMAMIVPIRPCHMVKRELAHALHDVLRDRIEHVGKPQPSSILFSCSLDIMTIYVVQQT